MKESTDQTALVVELEGGLLHSNLFYETALRYVRQTPFGVMHLLAQCGRADLKTHLAAQVDLPSDALPYNEQVLMRVRDARRCGRRVVLLANAYPEIAEQVARYLKLFDDVISSSDAALQVCTHGFDYISACRTSAQGQQLWHTARHIYCVNPDSATRTKLAVDKDNVSYIEAASTSLAHRWLKALRPYQWAKNLLLFIPLLAAHQLQALPLVADTFLAFLLFGLCASSVYLLNDILDVQDDRRHPRKRLRPFAAGTLSIRSGLTVAALLLVGSVVCAAWLLPLTFLIVLLLYFALTFAYSLALKRIAVIDVLTLGGLYTLRVIAGSAVTSIPLTFWMLAFSIFLFLSLALLKRYAELYETHQEGDSGRAMRGYSGNDLAAVGAFGVTSGFMSVLIMALYVRDEQTAILYNSPHVIWLACPLLLLWIMHVWLKAYRGEMHDDPVVFAFRDRLSLIVGILVIIIFWLAL